MTASSPSAVSRASNRGLPVSPGPTSGSPNNLAASNVEPPSGQGELVVAHARLELRSCGLELLVDRTEHLADVLVAVLIGVRVGAVRQDSDPLDHRVRPFLCQAHEALALC